MAAVTTQCWLRFYLFCHRFADYGCILEILSLELLPDGRSYIETVGGSRFRVLKRGHRDGYHTADIEYLEDLKVRDIKVDIKTNRDPWNYQRNLIIRLRFSQVNGSELELLHHLHDSVYQQTQEWYQRLGSRIREQINKQYGAMPDKEEDIQVWNRNFSTCLICCCVSAWLRYVFICCINLNLSSRPHPMVQLGAGGCCLSFSWTLHIKLTSCLWPHSRTAWDISASSLNIFRRDRLSHTTRVSWPKLTSRQSD